MHQPLASTSVATRRLPPAPHAADLASSLITIDITVPGTSSAAGRHALHAALGDDLRLYVITVDKRHDHITFRVDVTACSVGDVIGALMHALASATVGRVRATRVAH